MNKPVKDVSYYAIPDPSDPMLMTYWRRSGNDLKAWPTGASYGPRLLRSDVPDRQPDGQDAIERFAREVANPWWRKIRQAIDEDDGAANKRFATMHRRLALLLPTNRKDRHDHHQADRRR